MLGKTADMCLDVGHTDLADKIGLQYDQGKGALAPFPVRHANDSGFDDTGVPADEVFQIQGGNPLAASLDHILDAISDLQIAAAIDMADILGVQPAAQSDSDASGLWR